MNESRTLASVTVEPIRSTVGGFWRVATFTDGTVIVHRLNPDRTFRAIERVHVVAR